MRELKPKSEYKEKVLDLRRVTRVVAGGKRFSFRATVVIGDEKGRVGVGIAKGLDVAQAVDKAKTNAKKRLINAVVGIMLFAIAFAIIQILGTFTGFTFFAGQR